MKKAGMFLLLMAAMILAGCASSTGTQPAAETATATPDPLYSLHCIRQAGRNELCYIGQGLLGDNARLQQAAEDYCNYYAAEYMCSVHIWADEAGVGQTIPLTEAEKATRLARVSRVANSSLLCFEVYDQGEVVFTNGECGN